jgi:hypothetical protein
MARPCYVPSLRVATQMGPSHDPVSWTSGVWSLRILIRSCLGLRRFIAGFVASAARPVWLPNEPDGEASLSVYKTYNPAELNQPFLLVFCTHDIVTVPPTWDGTRSLGYSGFPAYGQMRTARLPARGATIYLRTVPHVTTRDNVLSTSGPLISDGLSWSPMRADYLIPPAALGRLARRIVSEDSVHCVASLSASVHPFPES